MKKKFFLTVLIHVIFLNIAFSQNNNIKINATLKTESNELSIYQEIDFFNKSDSILNNIYFHNWPNAYRDNKTPLAKRFVEKNSKSLHFAKEKNRGRSNINTVLLNYEIAKWEITDQNPDILNLQLNKPLLPNDSVKVIVTYTIKIPNAKFTRYGVNSNDYNLRYWYLTPAIFDTKWRVYNNLDLDDLYMDYTNYTIKINVPKDYTVLSDLLVSNKKGKIKNSYTLIGKNRMDVELKITQYDDFSQYNSIPVSIITNLNSSKLNSTLKTNILNRELHFIESYLGAYEHEKLLINRTDYDKSPVYGFNQLPSFLTPFSDNFEWDIKMFKVLVRKYINNKFLFNQREDVWLADGLQTYLMLKYVEFYYPEIKAIGNISKIWGIRNFNIAKIDFNDKYYFVNQFASRKNLDQSLSTPADSLSNFNQKIANKYKAGIGIKYLENYLSDQTITNAIKSFSKKNAYKKTQSDSFFNYINTKKELKWFKQGYLKTNKKSDYSIKKVVKKGDSLEVSVKNNRHFVVPIELFGIKDGEIKYRKWLTGIDSISKVTIPKNGIEKLSLNFESLLPEYNLRNNWKNIDKKIISRPIQLKFFKDIENPYYNQLFYTPVFGYNYYDGIILGMDFSNKTFIKKPINFKVIPSYSTKSNSFSGSYSINYELLPENKKANKLRFGVSGKHFEYAPNLPYSKVVPFASLEFRKKNYRDISSNILAASYNFVDKTPSPSETQNIETLKYNVFSLRYGYAKPTILEDIRFSSSLEISNRFSKISLNTQYRILTNTNTQFDFRFFAGVFLSNKTNTDFFSFALDRPTDYLFKYDYLGRSETSGFLSQQIIISEGGFKSKLPVPYANQWLTSINTSIGIWRWAEIYNDLALVKNKHKNPYFAYENGVRLNFIQDILEVYFPVYSNLGWEVTQPNYATKIRFVLVLNPKRIVNFLKRGFY